MTSHYAFPVKTPFWGHDMSVIGDTDIQKSNINAIIDWFDKKSIRCQFRQSISRKTYDDGYYREVPGTYDLGFDNEDDATMFRLFWQGQMVNTSGDCL